MFTAKVLFDDGAIKIKEMHYQGTAFTLYYRMGLNGYWRLDHATHQLAKDVTQRLEAEMQGAATPAPAATTVESRLAAALSKSAGLPLAEMLAALTEHVKNEVARATFTALERKDEETARLLEIGLENL